MINILPLLDTGQNTNYQNEFVAGKNPKATQPLKEYYQDGVKSSLQNKNIQYLLEFTFNFKIRIYITRFGMLQSFDFYLGLVQIIKL